MKVIGLGEILWRISPPNHLLFSQTEQLQGQFGGAELNVLSGLANLGYETAMVTTLPDNNIGQACHQFLRRYGVGTEAIRFHGQRLGLYFYERGFGIRPSRITYDRADSAFAQSTFADYDWEKIFQDADWLHVSGITVALNPGLYELTLAAMKKAKALGVGISFDLNYRARLWPSFEAARQGLSPFVDLADICIGLEPVSLPDETGRDKKDVLKLTRPYQDRAVLLQAAEALCQQYTLQALAFTQRELVGMNYRLKAYLYQDGQLYETETVETAAVDRVGTGDAFAAGLIFGHLEGRAGQAMLDTALASFVYKHTIDGDINLLTRSQLDQILTHQAQEISR